MIADTGQRTCPASCSANAPTSKPDRDTRSTRRRSGAGPLTGNVWSPWTRARLRPTRLSAEDREIQSRARRFIDDESIPREAHAEEHEGLIPEDARKRHHRLAIELGLSAMNMPKELGGTGITMLQQTLVAEQLGRVTNALGLACRHPAGVGSCRRDSRAA